MKIITRNYIIFIIVYIITADMIGMKSATPVVLKPLIHSHFIIYIFQIQNDPEFKNKLKAQALIYPSLQVIDMAIPSHRDNEHGLFLPEKLGIELACLYLTQDKALPQAMMKNQHMPHGSRHLFKLVNWSIFLPEKYKKNHIYSEPLLGRLNPAYSALLDSRLSPLAVNDSQLQNLPLTYILTCQYEDRKSVV